MKGKNTVAILGALIIGLFGFAPLGMAAQRAITATSLDAAYKNQISILDGQIQTSQENVDKVKQDCTQKAKIPTIKENCVFKGIDAARDGQQATQDKHILEVSYKLLQEALK